MNKNFKLKSETAVYAAEKMGLKPENVSTLAEDYSKFVDSVSYQYLAHTIRTMETYVRQQTNSPNFRIICEPMRSPNEKVSKLASARYRKGMFLIIVYDGRVDDDQKRILIAHELGHMFLATATNREFDDKHEPLSSMFGTLVMLHKNASLAELSNEPAVVDKCINIMEKLRNND